MQFAPKPPFQLQLVYYEELIEIVFGKKKKKTRCGEDNIASLASTRVIDSPFIV
jgi:hypothetical protein